MTTKPPAEPEAPYGVEPESGVALEASVRRMAASLDELRQAHRALSCHVDALRDEAAVLRHFLSLASRSPLARLRSALVDRLVTVGGAHHLGVLRQYAPRPLTLACPPQAVSSPRPSVSIVTPSLNQARYLGDALRSVLDQENSQVQCVVQDGGSTDGSLEILRRLDARIDWVSGRDTGQSAALNLAFARASGDVLAWLNSDDVLLPGAVAWVTGFFAEHPEVDVVYGCRVIIDEQGREVGRWILPAHDGGTLSWGDYVPQESLFWRRRIWEGVGACLDESFDFAMDWDLLLRFRAAGARIVRVPRFLAAFRVHEGQKTSRMMDGKGMVEMSRIRARIHGRRVSAAEAAWELRPYVRMAAALGRLHQIGLVAN